MKKHTIPLESLTQKGKGLLNTDNGELFITSKRVLDKNGMRACIPAKIKLPFRIDMTLKSNSSDFNLQMGKGYIHFSGNINSSGSGIRRVDILTGKDESVKYDYENDLPLNEYIELSVIYGGKMTWVEINGKPCYSTGKARI